MRVHGVNPCVLRHQVLSSDYFSFRIVGFGCDVCSGERSPLDGSGNAPGAAGGAGHGSRLRAGLCGHRMESRSCSLSPPASPASDRYGSHAPAALGKREKPIVCVPFPWARGGRGKSEISRPALAAVCDGADGKRLECRRDGRGSRRGWWSQAGPQELGSISRESFWVLSAVPLSRFGVWRGRAEHRIPKLGGRRHLLKGV